LLPALLLLNQVSRRGIPFSLEHVKAIRRRRERSEILFVPFYYDDVDRRRYLCEPHRGACVVNLCYEQFHAARARAFIMPTGRFAREDLHYCAWGPRYRDLLVQHHIDPARVHIVGNPRFDIYGHRNLLLSRGELAGRYGLDPDRPWVVVPCNFNVIYLSRSRREQLRARGYDISDEMVSITAKTRDAFIEMVRTLSERCPDVEIVVRAHPAGYESSALYDLAARGRTNVHLISEFDVANWIVQAALVVVWSSTTSMEAMVAGVPSLSYEPVPYAERFDYDVNRIVTTVRTLGDVVDAACALPGLSLAYDWARFDAWFAYRDGRVAERLADLVEAMFVDFGRFASRTSDGTLDLRWGRFERRWRSLMGRPGPVEPEQDRVEQAVRSLSPAPLGEFLR
jgi:surface carbohydrate biosynthesis protein